MKVGPNARWLALVFVVAAVWWPSSGLVAAVVETSRSIYDFQDTSVGRFRKLPHPEVVIPLPAVFEPADGGTIRCQLQAQRGGEPVRSARARLTVDLLLMDLDVETFELLPVGRKKLRTDGTGFDTEFFDFPADELPASADPAAIVVRGRFDLEGGKKADRVSARCSVTSEKRRAEPKRVEVRRGRSVGVEQVSGTSSYLVEPPRKLKRLPDPQQLAAIPRTDDDTLEIHCNAFALNRAGGPIEGARWTLLVELLVLDHASRTFAATPIAVDSQVTDSDGRAFNAFELPTEGFAAGHGSGSQSAWILSGLGLEGNKKAGEVSSTCLVIRR